MEAKNLQSEFKKDMNSETSESNNVTKPSTSTSLSKIQEENMSFKCNNCDASFSLKARLNRHIGFLVCRNPRTVHEGKLLTKKSNKANLKMHIESVHEQKKPFKCNICDVGFSHKGYLDKHIHEEKKPFKCNDCGTSYSRKGNLNRHIKSVHERKEPFKCNYCDKAFSLKGNLNRHIGSVHD